MIVTCTTKLKREWERKFRSSHVCLSVAKWGFALHFLAPEWLADRFPYLQEWLTLGFARVAEKGVSK